MFHVLSSACLALALLMSASLASGQSPLTYLDPQPASGASLAVVVPDVALVHTAQLLPMDAAGRVQHAGDASAQAGFLLDELDKVLQQAGSSQANLVRLHICVKDDATAQQVRQELARRFSGANKPAVTIVAGNLAIPDALVALDAVAAAPQAKTAQVQVLAKAAILPAGPRVFISGQAEPGDLAKATRGTMDSLGRSLNYLGIDKSAVVQLKAFVTPIEGQKTVLEEMRRFFADRPLPPVVLVEWKSSLPIEIELVAASPRQADGQNRPAIEFLTPEGMKSSPVFARVTRVDAPRTIYTSGLLGSARASSETQVRELFAQLKTITERTGSDFKHLAKATYYVSDDDASKQLNAIRPEFYDPARPPAASKAIVRGVGSPGRGITLDMIAVGAK